MTHVRPNYLRVNHCPHCGERVHGALYACLADGRDSYLSEDEYLTQMLRVNAWSVCPSCAIWLAQKGVYVYNAVSQAKYRPPSSVALDRDPAVRVAAAEATAQAVTSRDLEEHAARLDRVVDLLTGRVVDLEDALRNLRNLRKVRQ